MLKVTDEIHLEPVDDDPYHHDPAGFFARLRESRPVAPVLMPDRGRTWIITRYADVRTALTDTRLAKDVHRWPGGSRSRPSEAVNCHAHMLNSDPPDHTRLRRIVQKAFTPRRAEQLRPRTEEIATTLLDDMARARGDVSDLMRAYARPLPITVLSELLGIPVADRAWIAVAVLDYSKPAESERVTRELAAYFSGLIATKLAEPRDDLLSELVLVRDADEEPSKGGLTSAELLSTVFQLVMAGFDTTANLIASGTLALLTNPEEMARLHDDPSLLPAAVEELLRFTSPVNYATDRFTTDALPIGDVVIPAGEWVFSAITAANTDPAQFPDPGRLDLGRDTSGHVAFGYGLHYCLGAPLARVETEVALRALLDRFPGVSLAVPQEELRWRRVSLMNGLESLPVRLA